MPEKNALTTENVQIEQVINSNLAKNLALNLHLTQAQVAKANASVLRLMTDEKLEGTTQISKLRFCYQTATLDYKNPNAVAPIKYGSAIQAQLQYQAYIEDMLDCGEVEECNAVFLFEEIDYKPIINKDGFTELTLPETIKPKSMFEKPKIIGYYAYAKMKSGKVITDVKSVEQAEEWAKRYSIAYKSGKFTPYTNNKDAMFLKSTIKAVAREVLKWCPFDRLSKSLQLDQSVFDNEGVSYADNANKEEVAIKEQKTNVGNTIVLPQDVVDEQKAEEAKETAKEAVVDADGVVVDKVEATTTKEAEKAEKVANK